MSLFERIKDKRHGLQEEKKVPLDEGIRKEIIKRIAQNIPKVFKTLKKGKDTKKVVDSTVSGGKKIKKVIKKIPKNTNKPTQNVDDVLKDPNLEKAKKQFSKDIKSDGNPTGLGNKPTGQRSYEKKGNVKVNIKPDKNFADRIFGGGKKIEKKISNKAQNYTDKINKLNPNRPEYVKPNVYGKAMGDTSMTNAKQTRPLGQLVKKTKPSKTAKSGQLTPGQIDFSKSKELATKRQARINQRTGKATKAGVEDFAKKKFGKGDPTNQAAIKKAKELVKNPTSKQYKRIQDTINKSDYAGKFAKTDKKISKMTSAQKQANIDKIKAKIDKKNPTQLSKSGKGRVPVKGTVLKRSTTGPGFEKVKKTSPEGRKILKKQLQFDKPEVKAQGFGKKVKNWWKGFLEPGDNLSADFKKVRKGVATRNIYKGKRGAVAKIFNKIPTKYKVLAGLGLAGYSAYNATRTPDSAKSDNNKALIPNNKDTKPKKEFNLYNYSTRPDKSQVYDKKKKMMVPDIQKKEKS